MPFLSHIRKHRHADLSHFVPVFVEAEQIGWTKRDFAKLLGSFDFAWHFINNQLRLNPALESFEKRSQVVHDVFLEISLQGHLPLLPDYSLLGGDDWLPVGSERWTDPLFQVHRFYAACLGIRRESVMIHGYEDERMWLAVRGDGVHDDMGRYDMIVSGCMTIGQTREVALLKEGEEECGLTEQILPSVTYAKKLHTVYHNSSGFLMDEYFHVYELATKNVFTPKVVKQNEVSHFELLSIDDVIQLLEKTSRIKSQVSFMLVDFMIRHGFTKETYPSYKQIIQELNSDYQFS